MVHGSHRAEVVYPSGGGLAQASAETRRAAKLALRLVWPEGGTAMGSWLLLARDLLATRPGALAHAILLTDGRNESESAEAFDGTLAACGNRFQCDCRGVGTDWEVDELSLIASALIGTVDIVPDPTDLDGHFLAMAAEAMEKRVGPVVLAGVGPPWRGGTAPAADRARAGGADGPADRCGRARHSLPDRRLGIRSSGLPPLHRAAVCGRGNRDAGRSCIRWSSVGAAVAESLVRVVWTDDEARSRAVHPAVSHYREQAELVESVRSGLAARDSGDDLAAEAELGRAARAGRGQRPRRNHAAARSGRRRR